MNMPRIAANGAYDPVELDRYLDYAAESGIKDFQVATELGVPLDRIIFAMGPGRHLFRNRADQIAAARQVGAHA